MFTENQAYRGEILAEEHGVVGDYNTNDTNAINDIVDTFRNFPNFGHPGFGGSLRFSSRHIGVGTLSLNNINNLTVRGQYGGTLFRGVYQDDPAHHYPVIDALGSSNLLIEDCMVAGPDLPSTGVTPSCGWLFGATNVKGSSNANEINRVAGYGAFTVGQVVMYNTCDSIVRFCRPDTAGTNVYSLVVTSSNGPFGLESKYVTIDPTGDFCGNIKVDGIGAKKIRLHGTSNMYFGAGSIDGLGEACVRMTGMNEHTTFMCTQFTSPSPLTKGVIHISDGSAYGLKLMGNFVNNVISPTIPLVYGELGVTLQNPTILGLSPKDWGYNQATRLVKILAPSSGSGWVTIHEGMIDMASATVEPGGSVYHTKVFNRGTFIMPTHLTGVYDASQ